MDWIKTAQTALGIGLGTLIGFVLVSFANYVGRRRWFWYSTFAAAFAISYALLWRQYPTLRIYVAPVVTFWLGVVAATLWQRWPATSLLLGRMVRLSMLAKKGLVWQGTLQGNSVEKGHWHLVESMPPGMVTPSPEGLVTEWEDGAPGYHKSGFLVAQLELDEGDFCVEFEAKVERYGTGWDAGVHLLASAEPNAKICAALRYLPAPWSTAEHNALCLLSDDEKRFPFVVPIDEWVPVRLQVSGLTCRAVVGDQATGWLPMGSRPKRLVVGATPVDWAAQGQQGRYLFRNFLVHPLSTAP
ncbi:MAG TPA: hypothetical protein VM537_24515 [Anaerolineae bacterium]|nr:hypothetical protein [Anaerolineae bacterium]